MSKFAEYLEGNKKEISLSGSVEKDNEIWIQFLLNLEEDQSIDEAIGTTEIKNINEVKTYIEARKNLIKTIKLKTKELFKAKKIDEIDINFLNELSLLLK